MTYESKNKKCCQQNEAIDKLSSLGILRKDRIVTYLGKEATFYKIQIGKRIGYISATLGGQTTLAKVPCGK